MAATYDALMNKLTGMDGHLSRMADQQEIEQARLQERLKGRKIMFARLRATGANPFAMGGDAAVGTGGIVVGPDLGFTWSVRSLIITGLTASATTPDQVDILTNSANGRYFWRLNGNSFGVTWGRSEKILKQGEYLFIASVGTFASTSPITLWVEADQVPAEMEGELF